MLNVNWKNDPFGNALNILAENDNIKSRRFFIADGLLEPVHLSLKERDILIEGIIQTMKKCEQDIEL